MSGPRILTLTQKAWEEIARHALDTFPEECCGVILYDGRTDEVHRCRNIQNRLHALDPQSYPRDASIAYSMDPKELASIEAAAEAGGARLKAFYHSHPEHEAYFSEEDRSFATPFGEPTYPESAQIVVSIYNGAVKEFRAYAWAEEKNDFAEIPLTKISA